MTKAPSVAGGALGSTDCDAYGAQHPHGPPERVVLVVRATCAIDRNMMLQVRNRGAGVNRRAAAVAGGVRRATAVGPKARRGSGRSHRRRTGCP